MRIADIVDGSQLSTGKVLSYASVHHLKLELIGVSTTLPDEPSVTMVTICRDPSPHHAFCNTDFRRKELIAPFASKVLANHFLFKLYIEFPRGTSKVVSNSRGGQFNAGAIQVDPFIFKNGVLAINGQSGLNLLNSAVKNVGHAF